MSGPIINVHIDRIVLRDIDIDPDRAEILRSSLASELGRIITQEGLPEGMTGREISRISAPSLDAPGSGSERQIAGSLARSIHRSIRG